MKFISIIPILLVGILAGCRPTNTQPQDKGSPSAVEATAQLYRYYTDANKALGVSFEDDFVCYATERYRGRLIRRSGNWFVQGDKVIALWYNISGSPTEAEIPRTWYTTTYTVSKADKTPVLSVDLLDGSTCTYQAQQFKGADVGIGRPPNVPSFVNLVRSTRYQKEDSERRDFYSPGYSDPSVLHLDALRARHQAYLQNLEELLRLAAINRQDPEVLNENLQRLFGLINARNLANYSYTQGLMYQSWGRNQYGDWVDDVLDKKIASSREILPSLCVGEIAFKETDIDYADLAVLFWKISTIIMQQIDSKGEIEVPQGDEALFNGIDLSPAYPVRDGREFTVNYYGNELKLHYVRRHVTRQMKDRLEEGFWLFVEPVGVSPNYDVKPYEMLHGAVTPDQIIAAIQAMPITECLGVETFSGTRGDYEAPALVLDRVFVCREGLLYVPFGTRRVIVKLLSTGKAAEGSVVTVRFLGQDIEVPLPGCPHRTIPGAEADAFYDDSKLWFY